MSFRALAWVQKHNTGRDGVRLSSSAKACLTWLAYHHQDEHNYGWPSVALLADEVNVSERQVQRLVLELVERGLVRVVVQAEGHNGRGQFTNRYFLTVFDPQTGDTGVTRPNTQGATPASPVQRNGQRGDTGDDTGVTRQGPRGVTPATRTGDAGVTLKTVNSNTSSSSPTGGFPDGGGGNARATTPATRGKPYVRPATPARFETFEAAIQEVAGYAPTGAFYGLLLAYQAAGIDIDAEAVKIADWCRAHNAHASVRRIVRWLDGILEDRGIKRGPTGDAVARVLKHAPAEDPGKITMAPWPHWQACVEALRQHLSAANHATYIEPIMAARLSENQHLILDVTPGMLQEVQRFRPLILKVAQPYGVVAVQPVLLE